MSDDYFFGDEDLDNSAFIAGLDAFEATHNLQRQRQVAKPAPAPTPVASRPVFRPPSVPHPAPSTSRPKPPPAEVINISDDEEYKFDDSFDLENANWEEFDQRVEVQVQQPQDRTDPVPGPSLPLDSSVEPRAGSSNSRGFGVCPPRLRTGTSYRRDRRGKR
jgi:hypothetical protein